MKNQPIKRSVHTVYPGQNYNLQKTKLVVMQASSEVVMSPTPVEDVFAVGEEPRKVRPRLWIFVAIGIVSLSLISLVTYALVTSASVSDSLLPVQQEEASAEGSGSVNLSTAPTANQQELEVNQQTDLDPAQAKVQEGTRTGSVKTSTYYKRAAIVTAVVSVILLVALTGALAVIYTLHNKERELTIKLEENELRQAEEAKRLDEQGQEGEQDHVQKTEKRSFPWAWVGVVIVLWCTLGWTAYVGGTHGFLVAFTLAPILAVILFLIACLYEMARMVARLFGHNWPRFVEIKVNLEQQ